MIYPNIGVFISEKIFKPDIPLFDARGPDSYAGKEIFTILTHRLRNLKKRVGWVWYFLRSKKGKEWRRMTAPL